MAITKDEILEYLEQATILELNDLVKAIEEKFDVTAAAPVAMVAGPAEEEDTGPVNVTVSIVNAGATKVQVIKAVKEITGLGLGDAKAIVDGAPKTIKDKVPAEDAKKFEAQLKEAGATVELK